jgi:hypothetical protein
MFVSTTYLTHDAASVAAGSISSSAVVDVTHGSQFSVEYKITGSGTAKISYWSGVGDVLSSQGDLVTGITSMAGPLIYSFAPAPCNWMQIYVTETGTASTVTATTRLCVKGY